MREIKFRFWMKDTGMWNEHDGWVEGIGINEALKCSRDYGYIPMQYTGLKDKNEKEIYEGDVLIDQESRYWLVVWDDNMPRFNLQKIEPNPKKFDGRIGAFAISMQKYLVANMVVIGNVHEHPHLLTPSHNHI